MTRALEMACRCDRMLIMIRSMGVVGGKLV